VAEMHVISKIRSRSYTLR